MSDAKTRIGSSIPRCENPMAHPSHRFWTKEVPRADETCLTLVSSCINDGTGPNYTVETRCAPGWMNIRSPSEFRRVKITDDAPGSECSKFTSVVGPKDIRSSEDAESPIRYHRRGKYAYLIRKVTNPVTFTRMGHQYLPINRHYPSLDSEQLKNMDEESKGILRREFERAERNGESYQVASIFGGSQGNQGKVTWRLRTNPIGSENPPQPFVHYMTENPATNWRKIDLSEAVEIVNSQQGTTKTGCSASGASGSDPNGNPATNLPDNELSEAKESACEQDDAKKWRSTRRGYRYVPSDSESDIESNLLYDKCLNALD